MFLLRRDRSTMNGLNAEIRRVAWHYQIRDRRVQLCRLLIQRGTGGEDPVGDAEALQGLIDDRKPWKDALTARVLQREGLRVRGEIHTTEEGRRDPRLTNLHATGRIR